MGNNTLATRVLINIAVKVFLAKGKKEKKERARIFGIGCSGHV